MEYDSLTRFPPILSLRFPNLHLRKMTFRPAIDFEVATTKYGI